MSHLFGRVRGGMMRQSDYGDIAAECWRSVPNHFPHVRIDKFVIMPDHLHGILLFGDRQSRLPAIGQITPGSLGAVVRSFKSAAASLINALRGARPGGVWQRNYFDQIIANHEELERIRRYIRDNPSRWSQNRMST